MFQFLVGIDTGIDTDIDYEKKRFFANCRTQRQKTKNTRKLIKCGENSFSMLVAPAIAVLARIELPRLLHRLASLQSSQERRYVASMVWADTP